MKLQFCCSILRKKQTPAPPHDAVRLPQGKLVDPRLAALQGNGNQKPKSTAFENFGQQKAKIELVCEYIYTYSVNWV